MTQLPCFSYSGATHLGSMYHKHIQPTENKLICEKGINLFSIFRRHRWQSALEWGILFSYCGSQELRPSFSAVKRIYRVKVISRSLWESDCRTPYLPCSEPPLIKQNWENHWTFSNQRSNKLVWFPYRIAACASLYELYNLVFFDVGVFSLRAPKTYTWMSLLWSKNYI